MTDALEARGPDGSGIYQHGCAAFGHRRLRIIDLTDHAAQPMNDDELGLALVFNGAIYNYAALREELIALGYHFFSHGDTEVILKSYHAWGRDCVKRFNGMFAFAIHDRNTNSYFLARDRLGIKPLYYQRTPERIRFASTLPALLAAGDVDTAIDPVALHYYMHFHAVVPAPHTILQGVRKVPPATIVEIDAKGDWRESTYWHIDYTRSGDDERCSEEGWVDRVQEALTSAVKRRLVADVPVGVLLSGGVDSSLVVGLMKQLGQQQVSTFSIGFDQVAEEEGNEFRYSDLIANEYGTDHHKIHADEDMLLTHLPDCIRAMSEPMVSHDAIGFYLLSREVAKHVKVVQSGQGADEVFAGYHWYPPMADAAPGQAVERYAAAFFDRDFAEYARSVTKTYHGGEHAREFVAQHFAQPGATDPVDKALRLDTGIMLVDDPVKRVDNMTMAWGLEARVPFLDHELVELAAKIPARHKLPQGGKHVLKEAARRIIPHAVIDRPKGYFPVPALKYLDGPYLARVREVLSTPKAQQRGLFAPQYVEKLLAAPRDHLTPLRGSKLWQIALLEFWLQEHQL